MTNKDIVKTWFAAIDAKDFDGVKALMNPDHQFSNPMTPGPMGPDGHIGMIQMMTGAFAGAHNLVLTVSEGDHVAVRGRWKGTHTGDFNGVPASGKTVAFTFLDMFEIKGGKVSREAFEMNPMAIMAQIGAAAA